MFSAGWTVCAELLRWYLESVHPEQRRGIYAEPDDDDDETWVLFNAAGSNRAEMGRKPLALLPNLMTYGHHACRTRVLSA